MQRLIGWVLMGMAAFLLLGIVFGRGVPFTQSRNNITEPSPASTETATSTTTASNQGARQVSQNAPAGGNQTSLQQTGGQGTTQRSAAGTTGSGGTTQGIYDQNTGRTFYYDPATGRFSDPTTGNLYDYDPSTNTFTLYQGNRPIRGGW